MTSAWSQTQITIATFNAGEWSGNYYIYDWLSFSPSATGTLTTATSQLFACANGSCTGPAFYVVCSVNGGEYNGCPSGSLVAISDGASGYSACNGGCDFLPQSFTFSGTNQVTLNAGQVYYARPYICSFGPYYCGGGQALGGGIQTLSGTGAGNATATITPSYLAFPSAGSTLLTVTNSGTANLNIVAVPPPIGSNAPDFTIAGDSTCVGGATIAPEQSCTIDVAFAPFDWIVGGGDALAV